MNVIYDALRFIVDIFYNNVVANYAWAVLCFTLVVKIILLPLDIKQRQSTAKTAAIQPQIDALKKKYANDTEKFNQKQMELYKKEKINPLSGCLPVILQMVFLFAVFNVVRTLATEQTVLMLKQLADGQPLVMQSFLWIKNIWQPDNFASAVLPDVAAVEALGVIANNSIATQETIDVIRTYVTSDAYIALYAANGANITFSFPLLLWTISIPQIQNGYFVLPLMAAASQVLQSRIQTKLQGTQNQQQGQQKGMMQMMTYLFPLLSIVWCATSSAVFALYWTFSNVFAIIQSVILTYYYKKKPGKAEVSPVR